MAESDVEIAMDNKEIDNLDAVNKEIEEELDAELKKEVEDKMEDQNGGTIDDEAEKIKDEHFSQTKPDEFSSENFKIEIGGLPKYYPLGHLKKLLNNTLQLDAHKVKPGGMGRNVAYVNFKNEEARTKAKIIINGYKWQNGTLTAIDADPAKDPVLLAKIDFLKVPKKEHEQLPLEERIIKSVTPLHDKEYKEQIEEKTRVVRSVMKKLGNEIAQTNPELKNFIRWHKMRRKGQICELDDFVEAPVKEGYRNKCEFTIGKNSESEEPVVGFRVASYKEGSVEVGPIQHLKHINEKMKEVAKSMEVHIKASKHDCFDPFSHKGVWRQLTVRTSNNDDVLLIAVIHPQDLDEEAIQEIKTEFVQFFTEGEGKDVNVTSLYLQQYGQKESGQEIPFEYLWGKTYIEETILGKTFKASVDAFLQVNTPACETLYSKVAEVVDVDSTSVVLDICCGVGTIGLSLADIAYKVFGVEMIDSAVENARANAEANGLGNVVFFNGKAENHIDNMIERSERSNCIAIVDPPRGGLNGSVMNALRKCEYLDKIVYISCDPQAAITNLMALSRPRSKTYKGTYFVPIRATPVDLFPDTPHFELIIVFERYDECKWDRIMAGNPRPKDQAYFDRVPALTFDPDEEREKREKKRQERRNRERDNRRRRNRDYNDGGGYSGRGYRGNSGGYQGQGQGYGGGSMNYNSGQGSQRRFREEYGTGFQEGFQACMEALGSQFQQGFGQGGGWNMAKQQQQQSRNNPQGFYNDDMDDNNQWGGGGFNSNRSGMYHPGRGTGGGYNNSGMGMGGWNNQNSDWNSPPSKMRRGDNNSFY